MNARAYKPDNKIMVLPRSDEQVVDPLAPHSDIAELAVLGAVIMNPKSYATVAKYLTARDFFFLKNGYVWDAIATLMDRKGRFDYVTLTEQLRVTGNLDLVTTAHLTNCVNHADHTYNVELYAQLVSRAATRRRLMMASDAIKQLAVDEAKSLDMVIGEVQTELQQALAKHLQSTAGKTWQDSVDVVLGDVYEAQDRQQDNSVAFPFSSVDFSFDPETVTLIGALTGAGKTANMVAMTLEWNRLGKRVGLVQLELTRKVLIGRMLSAMTSVPYLAIMRGKMRNEQLKQVMRARDELVSFNNYLSDATEANTPHMVRNHLRAYLQQQGNALDIILIDGLYQFTNDTGKREYEFYQDVNQVFTAFAQEAQLPIVMYHQLNVPKARQSKTPVASDLRGGLGVAFHVDNVLAIHRDDHSELFHDNPINGRVDIYALKTRHEGNTKRRVGSLQFLGNNQFRAWH